MSRSRRRIGDAFASCDHDATRTDGADGCSRLQVYAHDPSHVAAAVVPRDGGALTGSDGHGAAWVKDEEADPGHVPSGHNRDCFIPL